MTRLALADTRVADEGVRIHQRELLRHQPGVRSPPCSGIRQQLLTMDSRLPSLARLADV